MNRKRVSQDYLRGYGDGSFQRRDAVPTSIAAVYIAVAGFSLGVLVAALFGWGRL